MAEFQESYFQDEIREGFKIDGIMKRAWAAQIEVLEIIDHICRKYGNIRKNNTEIWADVLRGLGNFVGNSSS